MVRSSEGKAVRGGTNYFTLYYSCSFEQAVSLKHEGLMLREMELPQEGVALTTALLSAPKTHLCLPGLCFSLKQDFPHLSPSLVWRQLCWFQGESEARREGKE